MSVLAWWAFPLLAALLTGAIMTVFGRRRPAGRTFEEIEHFQRFRDALERSPRRTPRRPPRSSA